MGAIVYVLKYEKIWVTFSYKPLKYISLIADFVHKMRQTEKQIIYQLHKLGEKHTKNEVKNVIKTVSFVQYL